jgi:hypothetical protein
MNKLLYSVSTAPCAQSGLSVAKHVDCSAREGTDMYVKGLSQYSPLCHNFIYKHVYMNVLLAVHNSLLGEVKNIMFIESRKHMYETWQDFLA